MAVGHHQVQISSRSKFHKMNYMTKRIKSPPVWI
jgi:hypothetical protein